MKSNQIQVGSMYTAKVAGRSQEVRIERKLPKGGWEAVSLATNKKVRIKTPNQLAPAAAPSETESSTEVAPEPETTTSQVPAAATAEAASAKAKKRGSRSKPAGTPKEQPEGEKKMSALDAAAQVLKDRGEPMRCKDLIEVMASAGLWHSDAPTPAATLSSAMLREITTKGEKSRFRKADRGLFGLNNA